MYCEAKYFINNTGDISLLFHNPGKQILMDFIFPSKLKLYLNQTTAMCFISSEKTVFENEPVISWAK